MDLSAAATLGVFAKWPRPGQVKTRLAAAMSPEWAAQVAMAFLEDTLDRLAPLDIRRVLAFAPAEAEADFARVAGQRFALLAQSEGDLGERMAAFFARCLGDGAERVVLVGTDSPTLPRAHVEMAFAELEHADVVLGPATDGGYCLAGCARQVPPIFEGLDWGGSRVLTDTVARLEHAGLRLALLPPWYDVDTPEDWQMLRGHVAALRLTGIDPCVPHTEPLLKDGGPCISPRC
jgi:rSAM/selenodomain-associated transferase 1